MKWFGPGCRISLRSLRVPNDLPMIHQWVNLDYAKKFWNMDGPLESLMQWYQGMQSGVQAHSYLGLLDHRPVAQVDVYLAAHHEIAQNFPVLRGDFGMHLLMAPVLPRVPELSKKIIHTFLEYSFGFPEVARMLGEPDAANRAANRLIREAGFRFLAELSLQTKRANLYGITREEFDRLISPTIYPFPTKTPLV